MAEYALLARLVVRSVTTGRAAPNVLHPTCSMVVAHASSAVASSPAAIGAHLTLPAIAACSGIFY